MNEEVKNTESGFKLVYSTKKKLSKKQIEEIKRNRKKAVEEQKIVRK